MLYVFWQQIHFYAVLVYRTWTLEFCWLHFISAERKQTGNIFCLGMSLKRSSRSNAFLIYKLNCYICIYYYSRILRRLKTSLLTELPCECPVSMKVVSDEFCAWGTGITRKRNQMSSPQHQQRGIRFCDQSSYGSKPQQSFLSISFREDFFLT